MIALHAHWQPPQSPDNPGGVFFWAETSRTSIPAPRRGKLPPGMRPREHPFAAKPEILQRVLGTALPRQIILWLPSNNSGPQPSPGLVIDWENDTSTPIVLAPWKIPCLYFTPEDGLLVLINLPERVKTGGVPGDQPWSGLPPIQAVLSADAVFWHTAASLALETLAAGKFVPVLAQADTLGRSFHARWLPVLDGPEDGARLAQLQAAMPPLCRAVYADDHSSVHRHTTPGSTPTAAPTPRVLLDSFLKGMVDGLARQWGAAARPIPLNPRGIKERISNTHPAVCWLEALLRPEPAVLAPAAQVQALASGHRAWMRNLSVSGDSAFRIAFRLETPQQAKTSASDVDVEGQTWHLHYLLQARDDPSLLANAQAIWETRSNVFNALGRRFENPQEKLLAGLGYAARIFPPIAQSLQSSQPDQARLTTREAYTFLREAAPLLQEAGFSLLAPPWWNKSGSRLGARLRLKPVKRLQKQTDTKSSLALEKLVHYQWELSLGETTLTQDEFRALAALKSPLVEIRGQWVALDPQQIEAAIRFWEGHALEGDTSLLEALALSQGQSPTPGGLPLDEVTSEDWLGDWLQTLDSLAATGAAPRLTELSQPASLKGALRPYQRYGYSWLRFFYQWGLGVCLADDMGLGKTIQTLALLLDQQETYLEEKNTARIRPSLLVCPTSVVTNWEKEIRRFAPSLTALIHQGSARLRGDALKEAASQVDVVLTSYAVVRQDALVLQSLSWHNVILDEAQNIKNPETKQTQSIRKLGADFRLALTGTPVENRLSELWSIMHFLNPGYLGSHQAFRRNFALPIERYGDQAAAQRLKKTVGPFILRRMKTDPRVIQDLPEKIEIKEYCHLNEEQATLYQAVVQGVMKKIETSDGMERRGLVLSMLMQLKQICNHPVQYLHQVGKTSAEQTASSIILEGRSGKLERLVELLEEVLSVGERALIFSQFAEMGQILQTALPQMLGCNTLFLHGSTPIKTRDQMVRRFQEDEHSPSVFILSLKAGGTGLNLTRANHVFHFDRWWNPAVEDQATDRAFRIGQVRNVEVHKFITTGTLEEMIDEMIESKRGLAQAIVGSGEKWLTELSTDDLRELVSLRPD